MSNFSAINPILYNAMSAKFCRAFRRLLLCGRVPPPGGVGGATTAAYGDTQLIGTGRGTPARRCAGGGNGNGVVIRTASGACPMMTTAGTVPGGGLAVDGVEDQLSGIVILQCSGDEDGQ